jgi:DNA-directed RNA polymerase subunit RPC12/RpoP
MSASLGDLDVTVACPGCGYELFLLVSEIAAQTYVRCPCCRVLVHLVDEDASSHVAEREVEQVLEEAMKQMSRALRGRR